MRERVRWLPIVTIILSFVLVTYIDYATDPDLQMGFFYFLPIMLTSVFYPKWGYLSSVLSSMTYYLQLRYDISQGASVPEIIPNTIIKTLSFILISVITQRLVGTIREKVRTNEELLETNQELDATMESMWGGLLVTDNMNRITKINSQAAEMLGVSSKDVEGKNLGDILRNPLLLDFLNKRSGSSTNSFELEVSGPPKAYLRIKSTAIFDRKGQTAGTVSLIENITAEKEIQKMKEDFIATVTHDLKNPITSVIGYTDILLHPRYAQTEEQRKISLQSIRQSAESLTFMVNNLLDTSKIESGVMQYNLQPFDISTLIRKAKVSFEPILQDKNATFIFSVEEPLWVIGDKNVLESVINNLIGNAAKYTSEEGFVEVISENNGTLASILIRDNGPGIPRDFMPFIFKRFHQAKGAKSGTGLGLYIAKNILEGHRQSLTVTSEEGKGTTFSFSLEKADASSLPTHGDK